MAPGSPSQPDPAAVHRGGSAYVGTSGWAYPSWKPDFYPAKLPAREFLKYYATRLNTVEVNYTFRALPSEKMTANWLDATGEGFRFSFKAPQRITHMLRLRECDEALAAFYQSIEPVLRAGRLGIVLFQLPPNLKADADRLAGFLRASKSAGVRLAFEFRHESWFDEGVFSRLRDSNAALCIAESDTLATPDIRTADFACYRLRKSAYSDAELREIAGKLSTQMRLGDIFVALKHEEDPGGALHAVALLELLRGEGATQ